MRQYTVTGMSCAACQSRVEKAVGELAGVKSCAVSLLTNSMGVEGDVSSEEVIAAVQKAGYGAMVKGEGTGKSGTLGAKGKNAADDLKDYETPRMKKRLIASIMLLVPLMYVSMGHMLWSWPLPPFLDGNHVAMGLYELLISALIMVINQKFFISGFKALFHRSPNMDTLIALGATASFVYSVFALFLMTGSVLHQETARVMYYMDQLYFESAATILTLITVGKMLESRSKGKTTNALKALMNLAPQTAVLLVDGEEKTVSIEEVRTGDLFVVRPGDKIPVDGIVKEGESAVNESAISGESVPVEKAAGDSVTSATINTSGYMVCEATRVGEDTTLSEIIRMVSEAAATKAPIAKIADTVSGVFVPAVIAIALVTLIAWIFAGETFGYAVARAVSVLVISCPCALGLATPVAIMVGNGIAAKNGILFKTSASMEQAARTQIVVLDKTGTVTSGVMKVTDVVASDGVSEKDLLLWASLLEQKSEHPISKAIVSYAKEKGISESEPTDGTSIEGFEVVSGKGLTARIQGKAVYGGNADYIRSVSGSDISSLNEEAEKLSSQGKTPVFFAQENELLGMIAVADTIKDDSAQAVQELKNMALRVVMLTGDNEVTARTIGKLAGVDEVIASVKPDGKEEVIRTLMQKGKVAMVGDGINDAPALTAADLGIAIGAGSDVAIDAADVVLMKSSLRDVVAAIRIGRATLKNIRENLFWAFFYNVIGIPLAAGCYVAAFGWTLNPMFGAAAMGLSSFCVVTNALRLRWVKVYSAKKDTPVRNPVKGKLIEKAVSVSEVSLTESDTTSQTKENNTMKISVKGMMCAHCEAHVKKALEAIDGITSATASHESASVTLETSKDVDESLISAAVTEAGYEYCGKL